jgi:hypothetical protein
MAGASKHNSLEEFWRQRIVREARVEATRVEPMGGGYADARLGSSFGAGQRSAAVVSAPIVPRAGDYRYRSQQLYSW